MAKDRTGAIVTAASPARQHLPMYWNSRNRSLRTKCNKLGFFQDADELNRTGKVKLVDLPWCAECERRELSENDSAR